MSLPDGRSGMQLSRLASVWFQLPLWLAIAQNAGAALFLGALVVLKFFAFRKLRS
jgi:hypothetical protein